MISFPNCKINIGLNILQKREDGYHNIETVFFPLPFTDVLEIIQPEKDEIEFTVSGIEVSNAEDNLCIKAYHLLKKDFPQLPFIKMHLHKAIPLGAGLGGGSADGAFTLKLLNEKFQLLLSQTQLINYALQLGSDCPFFIINKPCFASSRGEVLELIDLDLSDYKMVIVNPEIHINTGWAFSQIKPAQPKKNIKEIIHQPIETWRDELINDFEKPVLQFHPEIKKIKETLYEQDVVYASMTGSGSTVFGLLKKGAAMESSFPNHYFYKVLPLT